MLKEYDYIPEEILGEHESAYEFIKEKNIPGALFKIKDAYEIAMKIPCIMALIVVSSEYDMQEPFKGKTLEELYQIYSESKEAFEDVNEKKSRKKKSKEESDEQKNRKRFADILEKLLSDPLSMGSWKALAAVLCKNGPYYCLENDLIQILTKTIELYDRQPGKQSKYANIVNWRNEIIGHGTLMVSQAYWDDLNAFFVMLEEYLDDVDRLYQNINLSKEDAVLTCGNKKYKIDEYIYPEAETYFYFDSFYSNKKKTKVTDYVSLKKDSEKDDYFQELYMLYTVLSKTTKRREIKENYSFVKDRKMLDCLNTVPAFIEPSYVLNDLKSMLAEYDKGVFLVQMERGMGKSAFAHKMDGRYSKSIGTVTFGEDAVCRTYHVSDMRFKGANDFYAQLEQSFLENEQEDKRLEANSRIKKNIVELQDKTGDKTCFADVLSEYKSIFEDAFDIEQAKIIYFIDGIDEISEENSYVVDSIPSWDELQDGCFIVLLSRFESEDGISSTSIKNINKVKDLLNEDEPELIEIHSSDERYLTLLKRYIKAYDKKLDDNVVSEIIEKSNRKFLYVRPYLTFGATVVSADATEVAEKYMEELCKRYYGTAKQELMIMATAIAIFDKISLEEICEYIFFSPVTYDYIGIMNDLLPLLSVNRTEHTNQYQFANSEYADYFLKDNFERIQEIADAFRVSVEKTEDSEQSVLAEHLVLSLANRAEAFDRINDGHKFSSEEETLYQSIAIPMMEVVLIYLDKMLRNHNDLKYCDGFIDFSNYISAFGRANQEIKGKNAKLRRQIVEYCAQSAHVNNWFEPIFVSGDTFSEDRKRVIQRFTDKEELADYIIRLSDRKKYQGWYNHLHIENMRLLLQNCNDEQIRVLIIEKLKEVYEKPFKCPPYYEQTFNEVREKYLTEK